MEAELGSNKRHRQKPHRTVKKLPVSFKLQFSDIWENPELLFSSMATWQSRLGAWLPEFLLAKFPYIQAVTLVMLLAERALKLEKYPPMHPQIIYTIAAVCFLSGVMMSAKIKVKYASLLYAAVLGYLTYNAYTNKQFNYSKHDRNRISSRHLGCMGIYLVYAFIKGGKRNRILQRVGELCIAVYLLGTAYIFNESYEDRRALNELLPGGIYMRYFLTIVVACAGVCFLSGYFLKDISMSAAFTLIFLTFLVDLRFSYWTYRGQQYWNQVRVFIDGCNLLIGFLLFINHYVNIEKPPSVPVEEGTETRTKSE